MQSCKIWHASDGRKFPLDIRDTGQFHLSVEEISIEELAKVEPDASILHTFFIQLEAGKIARVAELLKAARYLQDYPKIIAVPADEYRQALQELSLLSRVIVLDDSIRPLHLKLFLSQVWQLEYYRRVVYNLSHDMRKQKEVYDNLIELARRELQVSRDENNAFEKLQEYDRHHKAFDEGLKRAMTSVDEMKDHEILELKTQLAAMETLSEYRDEEYNLARETLKATENVLTLSERENIERDKIINALDRLRNLTEQELLDLIHENNELRARLGLPDRSS